MFHHKGTANEKRGAALKLFAIAVCLLCGVVLLSGISFARYYGEWDGNLGADVAQWSMKVNGVSLADAAVASEISITLVKDGEPSSPEGKIAPGQTGYFDIEIDPTGTEVSFTYQITAGGALPNGMSLTGYTIAGAKTDFAPDAPKTVQKTVTLPKAGKFEATDKITVRFHWKWDDADFDQSKEYNVTVTATVEQYCG